MEKWVYRRGRVYWLDQYALNEHAAAFSKYDPDRAVEEILATGADVVAVYAANQFSVAYYPSEILPMHPNLGGRDYFGEIVSRLKSRGKKVVAYMNWLESRHPEWRFVPLGKENEPFVNPPLASWADESDPEKRVEDLKGGEWRLSCFNSPRRDQVAAVACEISDKYRPDAFHLDMVLFDEVCVCDYCRPMLEKICGTKNITREAIKSHWKEYVDWQHERVSSIITEVSDAVREFGVLAAHNAFAPVCLPALSAANEGWLGSLDVFVSECFDAFRSKHTDLNFTSINVRWQHAVGKPSWMLRTSSQIGHYSHWPISEAQWQVYAAACKANGCGVFGPCGVGAYPDTTSPKKLLANVKSGFDFYMEDADLGEGAVSSAKVGLIFSWATRKYHNAGETDWCGEFIGWARLLIEEHVPYDIVIAENAFDLNKYDLLILPNSAYLSDEFVRTIGEFVSSGGKIIATAETSLFDEKGEKRSDFALGSVLGIEKTSSVEGNFALERAAEPEPASGVFQQVTASGEIISRYVEVDPAGPVAGSKDPLPMKTTDYPAAAKNGFGRGESIYVAFDVGNYFDRHGDEHIAEFMAEMMDTVLPERQIEVKAPRTVEATLWEQPEINRTVIHLANRTVAWTLPTDLRQFTEIIPVHDIELKLKISHVSPKVTSRNADIEYNITGEILTVTVKRLEAYAAVTVEPD